MPAVDLVDQHEVPIDNGRLLALEDFTLERHVPDTEAIAE
jgi:hypothetical protein